MFVGDSRRAKRPGVERAIRAERIAIVRRKIVEILPLHFESRASQTLGGTYCSCWLISVWMSSAMCCWPAAVPSSLPRTSVNAWLTCVKPWST